MKVILANHVMMNAFKQGLSTKGKVFLEGVKIVKIEWTFKRNTEVPYFVNVPDTLKYVAVIEKDGSRFPDTRGMLVLDGWSPAYHALTAEVNGVSS
jgi:hypothetical protein